MEKKSLQEKRILPYTDENGYYEIRLESIGGLGANLAGKMLGELGVLGMELNASAFSSYGSEKRGSPVRAFVRYREGTEEILRNAPVVSPHLLGVFHEAMAKSYPVFTGVFDQTQIVLNTYLKKEEAIEKYGITQGNLYCLDAGLIARECKCRLNMVMLGALVCASGFLSLKKLEELCTESLGKKYPDLLAANLSGIEEGYRTIKEQSGTGCGQSGDFSGRVVDNLPQSPAGCGLDSMAEPYAGGFHETIGGVNPMAGNSIQNDLSPGREGYVPVFHPQKCIQCGLCDSACPDMVFRFEPGIWNGKETLVNQGPVYQYCKGCLRCVSVCPTAALTREEEEKAGGF
ncbi:MAG: 2-oxoacid:acceptor oxidoreductase family protein [Eubacteriales bacterium]|nr:2-oxoacid:acceptor oxidoreductase family protein [Eubacteriales bacterium]